MSKLTEAKKSYDRMAERAGRDVLREVSLLRTHLDRIEEAIQAGHRVPSSVTGEPFVEDHARNLARSIINRQSLYDVAALLDALDADRS